jgi:hypothetical protein
MSLVQRTQRRPEEKPLEHSSRQCKTAFLRLVDGMEIRGTIHLAQGVRPLDLLNRQVETFIAVTNANLSSLAGRVKSVDFIAVNKAHIVSLHEEDCKE